MSKTKVSAFHMLKDRERAMRKEAILDAAVKVFADKLDDKVNIREIAEEAGISTGSIYKYFKDQEALFLEAAIRGHENIRKMFVALIQEGDATIEDVAYAYLEYIMDHYEFMRMIQHCVFFGKFASQEHLDKFVSSEQDLLDLFDELFLKQTGYPKTEVRLLSHLFFASLNGIIFNYARFPSKSREQLLEHMKKLTKLFGNLVENGNKKNIIEFK